MENEWRTLGPVNTWRPKPGEVLIGVFRNYMIRAGRYGDYEAAVLETENFGLTLISGSVLIDLLKVHGIGPGETLKVEFVGYVEVKGTDRHWKKFVASVERPSHS